MSETDKLVERLTRLAEKQRDRRGDMMFLGEADPEIMEAAERIATLTAERDGLLKQRLMVLTAVYAEAPGFVSTICDESLDPSGRLLGEVRDLHRAALSGDLERG